MDRLEPAAASLAEQLMVVAVNLLEIFFNVLMGLPKGQKYPAKESDILLIQLLGFACFASLMNLRQTRETQSCSTTVDGIVRLLTRSGFDQMIRDLYEQYVSLYAAEGLDKARMKSIDKCAAQIRKISRSYRRQRTRVDTVLDGYWNRINDLVKEFFPA
jgi:hypothetical protein